MAGATRPELILFLAGEPDSGAPPLRDSVTSFSSRMVSAVVPPVVTLQPRAGSSVAGEGAPSSQPGPGAWLLPPAQIECANVVLEAAEHAGKRVTIVDVNRVLGHQPLVDRWVRPDDSLPLLVRADGSRLMGAERFVPREVRKFVQGR
jgi:hypothetical protein